MDRYKCTLCFDSTNTLHLRLFSTYALQKGVIINYVFFGGVEFNSFVLYFLSLFFVVIIAVETWSNVSADASLSESLIGFHNVIQRR